MSPENTQGWHLGAFNAPDPMPPNLFIVLVGLKKYEAGDFYIYNYHAFHKRVDSIFDDYISKLKKDGTTRKIPGHKWFDFRDMNAND